MDPAIPLLERLGLTQYEAKTYVALVGLGPSAASDIAEAADVPRTRIYSVLSDLEEAGWVEARPGRPKTFQAARPGERIETLREDIDDQIASVLPAMEAQYEEEATRFGGPIWLLDTADALARRTLEMVRAAREQITLIAMFPLPCDGEPLMTALKAAVGRGVHVRVMVRDEASAPAFVRLGAEVRVYWIPPRFLMVDGRQALFSFSTQGFGPVSGEAITRGMWIPAPEFVAHIAPIEQILWQLGEPPELEAAAGGDA